jgi:hypothetical protein
VSPRQAASELWSRNKQVLRTLLQDVISMQEGVQAAPGQRSAVQHAEERIVEKVRELLRDQPAPSALPPGTMSVEELYEKMGDDHPVPQVVGYTTTSPLSSQHYVLADARPGEDACSNRVHRLASYREPVVRGMIVRISKGGLTPEIKAQSDCTVHGKDVEFLAACAQKAKSVDEAREIIRQLVLRLQCASSQEDVVDVTEDAIKDYQMRLSSASVQSHEGCKVNVPLDTEKVISGATPHSAHAAPSQPHDDEVSATQPSGEHLGAHLGAHACPV